MPKKIGIVTSSTGAAIKDIISVIKSKGGMNMELKGY